MALKTKEKSGKVEKQTKSKDERKVERKAKKPVPVASESEEGSEEEEEEEEEEQQVEGPQTFEDLGLDPVILEACKNLGYTKPTPVQLQAIPYALQGRDVMGLAATGSGKTAAFALPVLQDLYHNPGPYFCVVLAPTRELAKQIAEQFEALGADMGLRSAVIIGGEDQMKQSVALSKKPHVIVATPGRLLDHLEQTRGFSLQKLQYLILDEADRLLDMDFKEPIDRILQILPKERHTFLFSATPSREVDQLKNASLSNPVKVEVEKRITTVKGLIERMCLMPPADKDAYLVTILNEYGAGKSIIVFTNTKDESTRLPIMLKMLEFPAIGLNGNMTQNERQAALNKFKSGGAKILIATNVAARGLDIPQVDIVLNYTVPENADDYIHRCGRTARAGRSGKAITFVTQYDANNFKSIENKVHPDPKDRIAPLELQHDEAQKMKASIDEVQRRSKMEMKNIHELAKMGGGRGGRVGGRGGRGGGRGGRGGGRGNKQFGSARRSREDMDNDR